MHQLPMKTRVTSKTDCMCIHSNNKVFRLQLPEGLASFRSRLLVVLQSSQLPCEAVTVSVLALRLRSKSDPKA
jgi:hypothetical protein